MQDTLKALFIYSVTFLLAIACFSIAFKSEKKKPRFAIFSIMGIFILCFVAGIRRETVGTDVLVYVKPILNRVATYSSLSDIANYQGGVETGFMLLAYLCSKISVELPLFLFGIELFQVVPIYVFAVKKKKVINPIFFMLVYLVLFYNASFNIMRQGIAAGFILLAYSFYEEKKKVKCFFSVLLAVLFHNSAIIAIAIIMASLFFYSKSKENIPWAKLMFVGLIITAALRFFPYIRMFLDAQGLMLTKYATYLDIFMLSGAKSYYFEINLYNLTELVFWIAFMAMCIWNCYKKHSFSVWGVYLYNVFISISLYILGFVMFHSSYLFRIGWINMYFSLPILTDTYMKSGIRSFKVTRGSLTILLLLAFYLLLTCYFGWHGTRPFNLIL